MGLDEFGREVPGMPSTTSFFGEASGLNHRFHDEDDDYNEMKRGRYHAGVDIRDPMEMAHVDAEQNVPPSYFADDNGKVNDHETNRLKGGLSYHSRRLSRSKSPDVYHKKKHRMSYVSASDRRKKHPSQAYTDGPLLCQFVWEKERGQLNAENQQDLEPLQVLTNPIADQEDNYEAHEKDAHFETKDSKSNNQDDAKQEYLRYNKDYCLKYIRHFFNQHLDDMWFRQRYSPLEYRKFVETERTRARIEAAEIVKEVDMSIDEFKKTNTDDHIPSNLDLSHSIPTFVMNARLGGGVKPLSTSTENADASSHSRKRKYSNSMDHPQYDAIRNSGIPKSHLFSFLQNDSALFIMDVPSFVSDTHLYDAIKAHSENDSFQIISEPVVGGVCTSAEDSGIEFGDLLKGGTNKKKKGGHYLDRCAWAIFQSSYEKEKVLESLLKYQRHHSSHHRHYLDDERGYSQSFKYPKVLELEIDCSDPFGRTELDLDGRGGLPKDIKDGGATEAANIFPIRHVSVFISSTPAIQTQSVTVLSAAISSKSRYSNDRKAAVAISKRLDIARGIPINYRLNTVLEKLFGIHVLNAVTGDNKFESKDIEPHTDRFQIEQDILDVAIAYLRRVHLFSFYNGCVASESIGSTLSGNHPSSTIHLRLHDADVILQKSREDNAAMYGDLSVDSTSKAFPLDANEPKDMLVMRLDNSITKAIDIVSTGDELEFTSPFVVNETIDPLASEIESMEEKRKTRWLQDHSLIDEDERARCSFHFCRKLFKDAAFLTKHLLKKHGEHLRAEIAKCHDQYMMGWWEEDIRRPVPPVLVDCGPKFGLIECDLQNEKEPFVVDPEPELWREEQQRSQKKEEEERKYHEIKSSTVKMERGQKYKDSARDIPRNIESDNYVDVDDMKDEKVELNFENIQTSKKSKKKKKKLL